MLLVCLCLSRNCHLQWRSIREHTGRVRSKCRLYRTSKSNSIVASRDPRLGPCTQLKRSPLTQNSTSLPMSCHQTRVTRHSPMRHIPENISGGPWVRGVSFLNRSWIRCTLNIRHLIRIVCTVANDRLLAGHTGRLTVALRFADVTVKSTALRSSGSYRHWHGWASGSTPSGTVFLNPVPHWRVTQGPQFLNTVLIPSTYGWWIASGAPSPTRSLLKISALLLSCLPSSLTYDPWCWGLERTSIILLL